tara:strand:+ start:571 stop:795 length:225 start_codon:yes stop_codon:yes gene_type:complete
MNIKMRTVDGDPAVWPIHHWFLQEATNEQFETVAETAAMAHQKLEISTWMHGRLTYLQSKDAKGRFVYDVMGDQ